MKLPFIIIVDDDEQVLRAIHRDIRNRYRDRYRVSASDSASEALELIKELQLKNETVALFISDQRMPVIEGVEFLGKAKAIYPEAKSILLTAYSDIEAAISAINTIRLDHYLLNPGIRPRKNYIPWWMICWKNGRPCISRDMKVRVLSVFNGRRNHTHSKNFFQEILFLIYGSMWRMIRLRRNTWRVRI
jgi:CheY-like chemotaxis protein